ncbi:hypothetical protein Tco_0504561 [Tanacetum coccineum]
MAVLESCPKHNMVAYLEKTDGNTEFHEIISFLTRSSIHYALTRAASDVSISEASIRSDLLFDDADGIDSLPNQAIFNAIQLMGFILIFLDTKLKNVPVPLDHFPINALTSKFFSFMVKKGKHFSGNVTPLFDSMLVQPTKDEGDTLERQSEPQPIPSPPHLSEDQHETQTNPSPIPSPTTHILTSIPEGSGGNHGGQSSSDKSLSENEGDMTFQSMYDLCISLCTQVTNQAKEIKHLKAQIKKLKKKAKPVITHHRAWMKSVSLKQRLAGKKSLKKQWMQKESVSKQGRKPAKAEPSVHKDPLFDELADDTLDFMDTKNAQDMGRSRFVVHEEKEREEKEVSTEDVVSTDKEKVSTDRSKVSTDRSRVSTDKEEVSTDRPDEGTDDQTEGRSATPTTQTPTPTTFGDDETIAQVLLNMSQAKAPLPKIDPKDKGKKKIEEEDESDTESEGIPEAEKKFKQLARDEEMERKVQEDWEAEEVKKQAEEEAIKTALSNEYDFIQARIKADRLLALRLQDEEREQFIVEERAKFLHDTIAAQRRFLAKQRAIAIRNKPPTRTQFKETPKKEDTAKVPAKVDVTEHGTKKRKDGDYLVIYRANGNFRAFNYLLEVLHIFDRRDLFHLYDLVMEHYSEVKMEGIELILWGDLKIMMESSIEENDQKLEDGTVIHMLVERMYPISKDLLQRMLDLGLEVERESTAALDLIRFIKQQIDEENKDTSSFIQALYEKVKRFDESFNDVGSTEDERKIKEMNEGAKDLEHKRLKKKVAKETPKKEDTAKVPAKVDVTEHGTKKRKGGHIKMLARKRKRPQSDVDSDDEHKKCLKILTFEGTMDSEIMERKSVIDRLNKVSSPDGDYLVIYRANGNFRAFNYLLEVLHIFDRQDLFHLYDLVMEHYSEVKMEGIELILWGDLKIMMESSIEENDQKLEDGTVIHMLVERMYPISKDLLQRMLDLGLEVERESTAALDLIRFIKQQIDEE